MTIVNTTYKFIYVHIPKTAGTAVKKYLGRFTRFCDVEVGGARDAEGVAEYYRKRFGLAKHSFAREIKEAVGIEAFRPFFKFSIVRNPYARAVSTFNFLKYTWRVWPQSEVMDQFGDLQEFVGSDFFKGRGPDRILLPQTRWLMNGKGRLCVDYVGRTETLEHDVAEICTRLGVAAPAGELRRTNQSAAPLVANSLALSGPAVDAIRLRYAPDFENFGYCLDPGAAFDSAGTPVLEAAKA